MGLPVFGGEAGRQPLPVPLREALLEAIVEELRGVPDGKRLSGHKVLLGKIVLPKRLSQPTVPTAARSRGQRNVRKVIERRVTSSGVIECSHSQRTSPASR